MAAGAEGVEIAFFMFFLFLKRPGFRRRAKKSSWFNPNRSRLKTVL
jgi:hypothetical protein